MVVIINIEIHGQNKFKALQQTRRLYLIYDILYIIISCVTLLTSKTVPDVKLTLYILPFHSFFVNVFHLNICYTDTVFMFPFIFIYYCFIYFLQYISHILSNNSKSQHLFLIFKSNDDNSLSGLWNIL